MRPLVCRSSQIGAQDATPVPQGFASGPLGYSPDGLSEHPRLAWSLRETTMALWIGVAVSAAGLVSAALLAPGAAVASPPVGPRQAVESADRPRDVRFRGDRASRARAPLAGADARGASGVRGAVHGLAGALLRDPDRGVRG